MMLTAESVKAYIVEKIRFKEGNNIFKKISLISSTKIRMHGNCLAARGTKITVNIK